MVSIQILFGAVDEYLIYDERGDKKGAKKFIKINKKVLFPFKINPNLNSFLWYRWDRDGDFFL